MKRGVPLSVRILLQALLNLVLLAALGWGLFRGQFGLGLDALLAGRAGDRLQSMADVLSGELARTPQTEWDAVLARTAAAYQLQLSVVRPDGQLWAGTRQEIPPEVRQRLGNVPPGDRPPRDFRPGGGFRRDGGPQEDFPQRDFKRPQDLMDDPNRPPKLPETGANAPWRPDRDRSPAMLPGGMDSRRSPPPPRRPRFLIRAGDPTQYWAGLQLPGLTSSNGRPTSALLLATASSLTTGGWVVDPVPWLLGAGAAVLLSLILWYPLVRGLTRAIGGMTAATERMAEGHFDTPTTVTRRDELGRLGTAINHLSGRLSHFVNGQRRFLGDIAHELCSPLARMQLGASLIEREAADDAQRTRVADVQEEVELMTRLVNELLAYSKTGLQAREAMLRPVALAALARDVAAREAGPGSEIEIDIPETLTVPAEPDLLARAIANLVRNSLRYAGPSGEIKIAAAADGGDTILTVSDHGPGVPGGELERIFEPFYRPDTARTREAGGTGLGLAIVRTCVEACRGTVTARSALPHGLEIVMRLPNA